MASHLRIGSVVHINGATVDQTVTDITDAYIEVEQPGSGGITNVVAWSWANITSVLVVTS